MRQQPLIIGAGPAGTAAAITLAKAGHPALLLERTSTPTDKVCGDFLSTDTIQQLHALGISPSALGGAAINCIRLIHGERLAEVTLPFPAMGLSRRVLDHALLRQAEHSGAVFHPGRTVRTLEPTPGGWSINTGGDATLRADTVFIATGKHDLRDSPRRHTRHDAVGMKMYLHLAPESAHTLLGTIELTLFPGGYAGLQTVEHGRAVLCIAVQQRAFQTYGASWHGLVAGISQTSRRFATMLSGAQNLLPRPLAVAAIPYGYQAPVAAPDGLYRLGDQAAVIPSLTGDGMAIALHSGRTAAQTWLNNDTSIDYHNALTRTLAPQMRLAGLLHHACMNSAVQGVAIRAAALFPALLRQAAHRTRVPSTPS